MSELTIKLPEWFFFIAAGAIWVCVGMQAVTLYYDYQIKRGKIKLAVLAELKQELDALSQSKGDSPAPKPERNHP